MITQGKVINELAMDTSGSIGSSVSVTVGQKPIEGEANLKDPVVNPKFLSDENVSFSERSAYLHRQLRMIIRNPNTKREYEFKNNKMSISGAKYIGIQQDEFRITLQNISFSAFGRLINSGFKEIEVFIDEDRVFIGMIKTVNTGRDSIVEKTIEINCLRKVTDLLSDMVSPITVNSSTNIYATLDELFWKKDADGKIIQNVITFPEAFRTLEFDSTYTFAGTKKTVVDDIIKITNNQLNRATNSKLNWIEYEYNEENVLKIFSPYKIDEILNMQPYTGLIDTPTVSEDSISFSSIYKKKLVPGKIVYMNNALFKTIGNQSAFVYAWDPNGQYVITEVRYDLSNYPNVYRCSCKARPFSKYNNYTASLEG